MMLTAAIWCTISIHALLAESDAPPYKLMIHQKNFYPRSPCGERPEGASARIRPVIISIHALLAESDNVVLALQLSVTDFYPRSPCGERRIQAQRAVLVAAISIHALLAESDCPLFFSCWLLAYFYPRSPCGERLRVTSSTRSHPNFYPRSPCGERRLNLPSRPIDKNISIHALLAESDRPL